jgi:hypothetical protein
VGGNFLNRKYQVCGLGRKQPFGKAIANRKTINERIIIKIHKSLLLPGNKAITKTASHSDPAQRLRIKSKASFEGEEAVNMDDGKNN